MEIPEEFLNELNRHCHAFAASGETEILARIRELVDILKSEGYRIVIPKIGPDTDDYRLLSDLGRMTFDRMAEVRRKKMEAIGREEFEFAADLRTLELELQRRIAADYTVALNGRFFHLRPGAIKEVVCNDFEGRLRGEPGAGRGKE